MTAKSKVYERKSLSDIISNEDKKKLKDIQLKRSNTSARINFPAKCTVKSGAESKNTVTKNKGDLGCPDSVAPTTVSSDEGSQILLRRVPYNERRNWITTDRLCDLRRRVQIAIKNHKTFTIRGNYQAVRKSLLQRGWVEKLDIHRRSAITGPCHIPAEEIDQYLPQRRAGETLKQHLYKCETNIMSRFLEHVPIDFLWSARKEKSDWIDLSRNLNLTLNRFHKSPFTTKEGLCNVLQQFYWIYEENRSELNYPRTYNAWNSEELADFTEDFRLTACISLLRFFIENISKIKPDKMYTAAGTVPVSCIQFAINQCKTYIRCCQHLDIDEDVERIWTHDWELFFMHFQMLIYEKMKFQKPDDMTQWSQLVEDSKFITQAISEYRPQNDLDGFCNIWIVKPANRCRGRGILLMNDMQKIMAHINTPLLNKGRWVIQKYIERPMIIHNCKFDIRQWFLITSAQPLVIWMYKESYLRFSSQEFDLVNFHESVHLTNHAIQKRYENGKRDERLPRENMWDCQSFQAYLRTIGMANMWTERIYPGMQRALIGAMLASQDTMDRRPNTFEMFGADFMISEDCQPWLIEINASPDLSASTSVTARLCAECLEDVIKVVLDYRDDPKASTGNFEMVYRQVIPPAPSYLGLNLCLKGTQMLPKNPSSGKDKAAKIEPTRPRTDRKRLEKKPSSYILSPKSLDFENKENHYYSIESLASARKATAKEIMKSALTKSQLNMYKSIEHLPQQNGNRSLSRLAFTKFHNRCETSYSLTQLLDASRRHKSCGPRIDDIEQLDELDGEVEPIECVGNKLGSDTDDLFHGNGYLDSAKSTARREPIYASRRTNVQYKLRPLNTLSKARLPMQSNTSPVHKQTKPKLNTIDSNKYRKYLTPKCLRSQSSLSLASSIHYKVDNSNLPTAGFNLRAWRTKTNGTKLNGSKIYNAQPVIANGLKH